LPQTRTFLYSAFEPFVRLGAKLFFRKFEIHGAENLPTDRPVVLVANHQNAMMDPVMICLVSKRQLHWLTRADVFKKNWVNKLLRNLNMLPVFRERDRVSDLIDRNNTTFQECYDRLKSNAVICIFPEGTHRGKKQLVSLKKGTARMVIGAVDNGVANICIVPVALDYENYFEYRKSLLLRIGRPIEINIPAGTSNFDKAKEQTVITENIRSSLSANMIDIRNDEVYHEIIHLRPLCEKISNAKTLNGNFEFFQKVALRLDQDSAHFPMLKQTVNQWNSLSHQLHIREENYQENYSGGRVVRVLFGIPFVVISYLVFYPIYFATESLVKKVVKDPLFRNSIRICFWTFVTPLWLLILFTTAKLVGLEWVSAVAIVAVSFLSGYITLLWREERKFINTWLRCRKLASSGNALFAEWQAKRKEIITWLNNIK
jgi:1-acyl-sn-glycerol-3-phosphate acyltransferase